MSYKKYSRNIKSGLADLHIHTTASDGHYSLEKVAQFAREKGLRYLAVTDHDTTEGLIKHRQKMSEFTIEIIPGIELSSDLHGREIHILGYNINIFAKELQEKISQLKESRLSRSYRIVEKLQKEGYDITMNEVNNHIFATSSPGRPHIALALIEKGYVSSIAEAFNKLLNPGCPGYVPRMRITPLEAVSLINNAGGVPVLAHPGLALPLDFLPSLVEGGLKGLEVFYPQHTEKVQRELFRLAQRYGLIITGGSDFHGHEPDDLLLLGSIPVPEETIALLSSQLNDYES